MNTASASTGPWGTLMWVTSEPGLEEVYEPLRPATRGEWLRSAEALWHTPCPGLGIFAGADGEHDHRPVFVFAGPDMVVTDADVRDLGSRATEFADDAMRGSAVVGADSAAWYRCASVILRERADAPAEV